VEAATRRFQRSASNGSALSISGNTSADAAMQRLLSHMTNCPPSLQLPSLGIVWILAGLPQ
jgi:hypothetical protein